MRKGKKGLAVELTFLFVIIFFLAVSLVSVLFVNDKIAEIIGDNAELNSTSAAPSIIAALDTVNEDTVNNSFAFLAGGMILSILLTAFLSRIHPGWFFVYLLLTGINLIVAAPLENIYEKILANPTIAASVAAEQTVINFFMTNLLTIMIVTTVLGLIIAMSKQDSVVSFGGADL